MKNRHARANLPAHGELRQWRPATPPQIAGAAQTVHSKWHITTLTRLSSRWCARRSEQIMTRLIHNLAFCNAPSVSMALPRIRRTRGSHLAAPTTSSAFEEDAGNGVHRDRSNSLAGPRRPLPAFDQTEGHWRIRALVHKTLSPVFGDALPAAVFSGVLCLGSNPLDDTDPVFRCGTAGCSCQQPPAFISRLQEGFLSGRY